MLKLCLKEYFKNKNCCRTVGIVTSLMIHACALLPSLASLGTQQQIEKWFTLARDYLIVGCYAQTELGHGLFLF